jgi:hypothetical protein
VYTIHAFVGLIVIKKLSEQNPEWSDSSTGRIEGNGSSIGELNLLAGRAGKTNKKTDIRIK